MKTVTNASIALAVLALGGCFQRQPAEPDEIPPAEPTGLLRIHLSSETPAEQLDPRVEEVWLRIDSVQVRHEEEGWIELTEERQDFDLVQDNVTVDEDLVAEGEVWVGSYDRIRINVADAWMRVDGAEQDLTFRGDLDPLDPISVGLTIDESFFVDEDSETTVRIFLDLGENLDEQDGLWSLGATTRVQVDIGGEGGDEPTM